MQDTPNLNRRSFIKQAGLLTTAVAGITEFTLAEFALAENRQAVTKLNPLPAWRGFNLLDFFSPDRLATRKTPESYFRWMSDWGFDFIRLPIAYPSYLNFDRSKPIKVNDVYKIDEAALDKIDSLIITAHKYNMHVSLNLHRAPGYCINAGFDEPYNLWLDPEALEAFCFHWSMWANRYKGTPASKISFDLLNEPTIRQDMNNQYAKRSPVPGQLYRKVAKAGVEAIHKISPERLVIADGNNAGRLVTSEIIDLNIAQSCRGYTPETISHYKAPWVYKDTQNLAKPLWPGKVGHDYLSRKMLEDEYKPWLDLVKQGVGVHCGECGCWNKTPHNVFLSWFADVLDIFTQNKIGFGVWEFQGDFGVLDSGRTDVVYENWYGHKLDRKMLQLLQKQMK